MSEELTIDYRWLGGQSGDSVERAFYADIGLVVGEDWLTLLEDQEARTVARHLRADAHRLAMWFAANWWRLRWEPETPSSLRDTDWRMAHSMASAGGGYVWPNVIFASDGGSVAIRSRPGKKSAPYEPIRYLNSVEASVTAAEFERKVDAFMAGVCGRLHSSDIGKTPLLALWQEILEERRDTEASRWRKLEALCGYDPDEAPVELVRTLIEDSQQLGEHALEEIAAFGRHSTAELLKPILDLAAAKKVVPGSGGFRGKMPQLTAKPNYDASARPWQRATKLAQLARKEWGLEKQPINNKRLAELLGIKQVALTSRDKAEIPLPLALKSQHKDEVNFYFKSSWSTARRFAAGRLLGDHLSQPKEGRLIPATEAKTSRQKFQRAFAQEFLCPFDALMEKIQTNQPGEEDTNEAADYFEVSPLTVRRILENNGVSDREVMYSDV